MSTSKNVIRLIGIAAKKAAECSLAMEVADNYAADAAKAFEQAALAQEAMGLDATSYWANCAMFRGIEANGKALNFKSLITEFVALSEVCSK